MSASAEKKGGQGRKGAGGGATAAPLASASASPPAHAPAPLREQEGEASSGLSVIMKYAILGLICLMAFCIRLFAVVRYESVIHEFDPYFNFRTTKYLAAEGFLDFLDWFDDRGWYPLGRTIGGTIYPGLMLTAASIHWALHALNFTVNIRNVCVFLAPLFAANTAIASYLLTTEVTGATANGLLVAAFTAIVPSYISRSVGGSYDNEGVAIFALIFTFYLWIKSVNTGSMMWAAATALSYFYMVAAWGGYVFIINIIPIYTLVMIVAGKYSGRLYVAYTTFYTLGTLLAMQVPFVGFNVVKQAECAASHGLFVAVQAYAVVHFLTQVLDARVMQRLVTLTAVSVVAGVGLLLVAMQLMGWVQWTGRSLTLLDPTYASKYIPIIASVSEHQPTTWSSYFFDLHILVPLAPVGLFFLFQKPTDGAIFLIIYGTLSWYFAGVMVRLMLTLAPIACILAGIGISNTLKPIFSGLATRTAQARKPFSGVLSIAVIGGFLSLLVFYSMHSTYVSSMAYSNPSIVIEAGRTAKGQRVLFDDYREAYYWLRHNTEPDVKIMSWWDYGYQLSAMSNRTVIVDNNTWNNTHIATVGRALASTEEKAYPILESLDVDYFLVIFGGVTGYSSDDVNKFLWPVRIGTGVFPDDMPSEKDFLTPAGAFDVGPSGSKVFQDCLAYKLCYYRFGEMRTEVDKPAGYDRARQREIGRKDFSLTTFEEAFTSEHWIVRIYRVLPRPNLDPVEGISLQNLRDEQNSGISLDEDATFVGCFSGEAMFEGRTYEGGSAGASYNIMYHKAKTAGRRYFAMARNHMDGHGFLFDKLVNAPRGGDMRGEGCERACSDRNDKICGCMDNACTGPTPPGEEFNRRWAVYELGKKNKR